MSFRNSLTRHLTPVGNAHIRSELAGGGARSWRLPVVVVVVVDGVPQLTNTPPHYYRSPLSSFEAWSELFSHHPPPFVPGTGGGAGEGAEGRLAMGTDKQTDLDPSCVTHPMKQQMGSSAAHLQEVRRRPEGATSRNGGGAPAVLSPLPPPSKVLDFPQRATVRIGIKSHLSGVTGAGGAY